MSFYALVLLIQSFGKWVCGGFTKSAMVDFYMNDILCEIMSASGLSMIFCVQS